MIETGGKPPERFNLARYCLANRPADKPALIVADGTSAVTLTYGSLEDSVLRLAGGLSRAGLEEGKRLLIRMESRLDYALVSFAAVAAGGVPTLVSPQLTAQEISLIVKDSRPWGVAWDGILAIPSLDGVVLLSPDVIGAMRQGPAADYAANNWDDPAYLTYTSGTTRLPRGVLHAHRSVWGRRPMYEGWYGISPDDVLLHTGALNWTYTLGTGLADPFVNCATAIIYTGPRNISIWEQLVQAHNVTIFASVPGVYRELLRNGFRPPGGLRHGLSAGEALAPSLLKAWRETTGSELYEALGMSEISTYISSGPRVPVRPGSPGKPQPGRRVRIGADGQIAVHGSDPGLMIGYLNELPRSGEWFETGDLGYFDSEGYFWYEGRVDDLMNAGGYRVSPVEVEAVLARHPSVAEVAVREVRISETLSIIGAFVVPAYERGVDEKSILSFAGKYLARYKCPKQIWLRTTLPRSANGKLLRKALFP